MRRLLLLFLGGLSVLGVVNGWSFDFVRALMLAGVWVFLGYLAIAGFLLTSERIGSVRRNKRALYAARKSLANGEGGWLRVLELRVRLYLALRARKDMQ